MARRVCSHPTPGALQGPRRRWKPVAIDAAVSGAHRVCRTPPIMVSTSTAVPVGWLSPSPTTVRCSRCAPPTMGSVSRKASVSMRQPAPGCRSCAPSSPRNSPADRDAPRQPRRFRSAGIDDPTTAPEPSSTAGPLDRGRVWSVPSGAGDGDPVPACSGRPTPGAACAVLPTSRPRCPSPGSSTGELQTVDAGITSRQTDLPADLHAGMTRGADREEQFRIGVAARRVIAPAVVGVGEGDVRGKCGQRPAPGREASSK